MKFGRAIIVWGRDDLATLWGELQRKFEAFDASTNCDKSDRDGLKNPSNRTQV